MASPSSSSSSETNYPYPSELDVLKFVPHPLSVTPNNYVQWSQQMHNLIESQRLVGFIDGNVKENEDRISWKLSDELLQKWIRTTLAEDILKEVKLQTARELWTYLETIFELLNYVNKSLSVSENNYYSEWRQQMYKFIESKDYVGHIDRSGEAPLAKKKSLSWEKRDTHVRGWIRITLTKDIRKQMSSLTAQGMWATLEKMFGHYVQLHKAVIKGDWESAKEFIKQDNMTIRAGINEHSETMLIVAVKSKQRNNFVEQLKEQMSSKDLALGDKNKRTALHKAAGVGNIDAAKLLVEKNPYLPNAQTTNKRIPLYFAATHGNREMVLYLLTVTVDEPKPKSPNHLSRFLSRSFSSANCSLPSSQNQKLIEDNGMKKGEKAGEWNPTPFKGELGFRILHQLTVNGFDDIALAMLKDKPELAFFIPEKKKDLEFHSLMAISQKPSSIRSGTFFNFFENFIYWCVPVKLLVKLENKNDNNADHDVRVIVENPADGSTSDVTADVPEKLENNAVHHIGNLALCITSGVTAAKKIYIFLNEAKKRLNAMFWDVVVIFVPCIKHIRDKKLEHQQAVELVKFLCQEIANTNGLDAKNIFSLSIFQATSVGIYEIVEEILRSYPDAISFQNEDNHSIFGQAILCRCEKVFNLIYQVEESRTVFLMQVDKWKQNALHLARALAPKVQLYRRAGAALQMQRELQWFKEVEKLALPQDKEKRNEKGKTPAEVFTETHEELVKEGEQWLKNTANASTIVAALIATVVFAAAITVPGGNNNNGNPIFYKRTLFLIFGISDAIALFSSMTSVMLFLYILTCRYGEHDFLFTIPRRLIFGLITLFLSILSTTIAFGATLHLVFGDSYKAWIIFPLVALPGIPATLFVFLQFPLLVYIFKSTYRSIFRKQSDVVLY